MKFLFIIDPIAKLDPKHDTSVAFMEASVTLGHEVFITQMENLSVKNGKAWASVEKVTLKPVEIIDCHYHAVNDWYEILGKEILPLEEMNAVFMRTDPPVTIPYLYTTYILDLVDPKKTLVVNSPKGLRNANEKMYALQFESVIPETIVSQSKEFISEFLEQHQAGVIKPLGGKGGEGILLIESGDRNFNSLIEISTKRGFEPIMVQTFLPKAKEGDKRIILLDGEPIGAVNRIPTGKEFRGNMAVGGRIAKTEITPKEREICATLAPKLKEDGLYFVGIDVIGGYLTEINVTSPTGIREIDLLDNVNLGKQTIQWVENQVTNFD